MPASVAVRYGSTSGAVEPTSWETVGAYAGRFKGAVRLDLLGAESTEEPSEPIVLMVDAVGRGGSLLVYDQTRVLSPSGFVSLGVAGADIIQDFWTAAARGSSGSLGQAVTTQRALRDPVTGDIVLDFKATASVSSKPAQLTGRAHLRPNPELKVCPSETGCPSGYTCRDGFCTTSAAAGTRTDLGARVRSDFVDSWLSPGRIATLERISTRPEKYICTAADENGEFARNPSQRADRPVEVMKFSGDPWCVPFGGGPVSAHVAVPLLYAKDAYELKVRRAANTGAAASEKTAAELFEACRAELQREAPPDVDPPPPAVPQFVSNLGPGFLKGDAACVSLGNFLSALYFSRPSRQSALKERYYAHLLRQWTELHAFIARQGQEQEALESVLESAKPGDSSTSATPRKTAEQRLDELLDLLERSWTLVLQESSRPGGAVNEFAAMTADGTYDPDWRLDATSAIRCDTTVCEIPFDPQYEQQYGLAPALLEGLASHMVLAAKYLDRVAEDTYSTSLSGVLPARADRALNRYGDLVRLSIAVQAIAQSVYDKATTNCATPACRVTPAWEPRWQEALAQLRMRRVELAERAAALRVAANPLGVDENDLPLFFGDVTGTNSRFFASSDYLLGNWADPAAMRAASSLQLARDAWINARNSVVQDQLLKAEQQRRLEHLAAQYGDTVIQNCGVLQSGGVPVEAKDVLDLFGPNGLRPSNCFVEPSCRPAVTVDSGAALSPLLSRLSENAAKLQLCKWRKLSPRLKLTEELLNCVNGPIEGWDLTKAGTGVSSFSCQGKLIDFAKLWGDYGQFEVPLDAIRGAEEVCEAQFGAETLPVPEVDATCFRGAMGEQYSRIVTAKDEVTAALAHLQRTQVAAAERADLCLTKMQGEADEQIARRSLDTIRENWERVKGVARDVQVVTGTAQGVLAGAGSGAVAGAAIGSAGGPWGAAAGAVIGGAIGFFSSSSSSAERKADDQLRLAESNYAQLLQVNSRREDLKSCWGDFNVLKVQIDADIATIRTRASEVQTAIIAFSNLLSTTAQKVTEGKAVLAREANRPWGGYSHHFWFDEKVETFKREFSWAKRLTYLAMRAVEYEFQQTLDLRKEILIARHPDQLLAALQVLHQEQAGRTINRRRPEESSLVLSVRDDILKVSDRRDAPPGERAWSPAQRFKGRLLNPQYAIYDESGNWLGQGVRFSLDPNADRALGGVPLVSRCAERLWRITATVQGDALSSREPGSPLFVLKQNTFASQWCAGKGEGEGPLQTAAVQPARQLFRPSMGGAPIDESQSYTGAALYPFFNVRRTDFYKKQYQDGASEELAGRGVYGDYVILFPKKLIDGGFKLENVEDILLRLDYLSVDNLPNLLSN